jgi:putative selenate reductase
LTEIMAELTPIPFAILATRLFSELEQKKAAFDLPERFFYSGSNTRDLSLNIHGGKASTPFGPAAGPHTQLAQNIVLAWLCGGRFMELKTVQIKDELAIPRPCIDMQTVGFNVEWSQELKLAQSLEEYVKASMLIEMLQASGRARGCSETVFDMSVGYDLAGISSPPVRGFLAGLMDAGQVVERLRAQIPPALARFRDLPFKTRISDTLTLSTFHGCPPDEIEAIARFLLQDMGLNVVVKLNPTLLGRGPLLEILHGRLGYTELTVPDSAFEGDPKWEQVAGIVDRLGNLASQLGRGFGVKFSNTLLVKNHKAVFPATESQMYMSGLPLHVLAMVLVQRFRAAFGDRFPVSFSAGIDDGNFPEAVALGLKPVTVCSDLLKAGGYGRAIRYLTALEARMDAVGARSIDEFIVKAFGHGQAALRNLGLAGDRAQACKSALDGQGDLAAAAGADFPAWVSACLLLNTNSYVEQLLEDHRYSRSGHPAAPRKLGSTLALFDCTIACNKCLPVCPNDANFAFVIPPGSYPVERLVPTRGGWRSEPAGALVFQRHRQLGNFADACNECGNCDVFCPEDGSPYRAKSRFFGSAAAWKETPGRDGFAFALNGDVLTMHGRFDGEEVLLETSPGSKLRYAGKGFDIRVDLDDPLGSVEGQADAAVDLRGLRLMDLIRKAVTDPKANNFISTGLLLAATPTP